MKYRRNYVAGGTYFFTVNMRERNQTLLIDHIQELRDSVRWVKQRRPFNIDAWVVLPDHMHTVWTLPADDWDFSSRWREIKKRFSKALPPPAPVPTATHRRGERSIWQKRFWEHTIRSEADYKHHVDYVHLNPVKHGLVSCVKDWPYSSFHRGVRSGDYNPDWLGTDHRIP